MVGPGMAKKLALGFLWAASPLMLVIFSFGTSVGEGVACLLVVLFPVALIILGAERNGKLGPLVWPISVFAIVLIVGFFSMFMLAGQVSEGPWLWGVPLSSAIQFYFVFLVPLLLISLTYGFTFDRFGLRQNELDDLRRRFGQNSGVQKK